MNLSFLFLHTHMKKIFFITGIVALTLVAIIVSIQFLPASPTSAEMEKNRNTELEESRQHKEKARLYACDLYATLFAQCMMRKLSACAERDRIEAEYESDFNDDPLRDCEPDGEETQITTPPADPKNQLFFGDEEVKS